MPRKEPTYAQYRAAKATQRLDGTEGEDEIADMIAAEVQATLDDVAAFLLQECGDTLELEMDVRKLPASWVDRTES